MTSLLHNGHKASMAISDFQETMVFTFYINIDLYIIIIYNYDESYAFYMYLRFTFLHIYIIYIYLYTGWWFGIFYLFFHSVGNFIIPTDDSVQQFSEG
jgi:hypothetical protein